MIQSTVTAEIQPADAKTRCTVAVDSSACGSPREKCVGYVCLFGGHELAAVWMNKGELGFRYEPSFSFKLRNLT